jgi:cellulose synthase/poly-beta-1,6-N-acetylglucosamine synthase-like glycosyltransferase
VSVVVISKDEPELSKALASLRPQCDAILAECVVVDASEGRLDMVRDTHRWVTWEPFDTPGGRRITIAHQRNVGVRASQGRIIAFCDASGVPHTDWLQLLVSPLLDGRCVASTGPIRPLRPSGAYGVLNDFPDGSWTTHVVSANFAFTKDAFESVSGFDERYDYGSDAVLGWRLEEVGTRVLAVRDAVMLMDWGDGSRERRRAWVQGRSWGRQLRLYKRRRFRILRSSPYTILDWAVLLGVLPSAALAWALWAPWVFIVWAAALAVLVWCTRPKGGRMRAVTYHLIHGVAACVELATFHPRQDTPRGEV